MKNNLSSHNLCMEDGTKLTLDEPLRGLLAATGAMHWNGAKLNNDDDNNEERSQKISHLWNKFDWVTHLLMWQSTSQSSNNSDTFHLPFPVQFSLYFSLCRSCLLHTCIGLSVTSDCLHAVYMGRWLLNCIDKLIQLFYFLLHSCQSTTTKQFIDRHNNYNKTAAAAATTKPAQCVAIRMVAHIVTAIIL